MLGQRLRRWPNIQTTRALASSGPFTHTCHNSATGDNGAQQHTSRLIDIPRFLTYLRAVAGPRDFWVSGCGVVSLCLHRRTTVSSCQKTTLARLTTRRNRWKNEPVRLSQINQQTVQRVPFLMPEYSEYKPM